LRVIQQKAVDGAVATDEAGAEAGYVEACYAFFAAVAATMELDIGFGGVGEEAGHLSLGGQQWKDAEEHLKLRWEVKNLAHLLVQALVEVVSIFVLELSDFFLVLRPS
jgi:hypothetical protein